MLQGIAGNDFEGVNTKTSLISHTISLYYYFMILSSQHTLRSLRSITSRTATRPSILHHNSPRRIIQPIQHFTMSYFETKSTITSFGGKLLKLSHESESLGCEMNLNLYLPPQADLPNKKVPVLVYLAGLTCTGDNGAEKGFFQYSASQKGIAVVYPDTSPRTSLYFFTFSPFSTFCV